MLAKKAQIFIETTGLGSKIARRYMNLLVIKTTRSSDGTANYSHVAINATQKEVGGEVPGSLFNESMWRKGVYISGDPIPGASIISGTRETVRWKEAGVDWSLNSYSKKLDQLCRPMDEAKVGIKNFHVIEFSDHINRMLCDPKVAEQFGEFLWQQMAVYRDMNYNIACRHGGVNCVSVVVSIAGFFAEALKPIPLEKTQDIARRMAEVGLISPAGCEVIFKMTR